MEQRQFINSFPSLDMRFLFSRRIQEDPILGSPHLYFYASARAALFYLIRMLQLK
jgi:hypothetical protein